MSFNPDKFVENQRKTRQQNIFNPYMFIALKLKSNINLEELIKQDKIKVLKNNLIKEYTNKLLDLFEMEQSLKNVEQLKKKYPFEKCGFKSVWENSATTADVIQVQPFSMNVPGVSTFEDFIKNQVNSNFEKKLDYFMAEKNNMKESLEKKQPKLKEEEEKLQELLNLEDTVKQNNNIDDKINENKNENEDNADSQNIKIEDLKQQQLLPYGQYLVQRYDYNEFSYDKLLINNQINIKYKLDKQALDMSANIVNQKLLNEIVNFNGGFDLKDVSNICENIFQKFPWSIFANKGSRLVKTNVSTNITATDNEKDDATMLNVRQYQKNQKNFKNKIKDLKVKRDDQNNKKENKKFQDDAEVTLMLAESLNRTFQLIRENAFRDMLMAFGQLTYQVIFMKLFSRDSSFQNNLEKIQLKSLELWYGACKMLKHLACSDDLGIPVLLVNLRIAIFQLFEKRFPAFFDGKNQRFRSEFDQMQNYFHISYNNMLYDLLDCEGIQSTIPSIINKIPEQSIGNQSNKVMNTKTTPYIKAMIYDSDALKDPVKSNTRINKENIVERMRRIRKLIATK